MPSKMMQILPALVLAALLMLLWGLWSVWILVDEERHQGLFPSLRLDARSSNWRVVEGYGEKSEAGLEILAPGIRGETMILLNLPTGTRASQFERVVIQTTDASSPDLDFEWSFTERFTMAGREPVVWQAPGRGVASLDPLAGWEGEPRQLVLRGVGFSGPWVLASVELHPPTPDFWGIQRRMWEHIYVTDRWQIRNINWQYPQRQRFEVPVTLFLAIWVLAALLVLVLMRLVISHSGYRFSGWWFLVPVAVAWLVLDLRWQVEVLHKAHQTLVAFGGLEAEERGQAEPDAELFEFSRRLDQRFERAQFNRVFAIGDPYVKTRLRYRLAAWGARAISVSMFRDELIPNMVADDLLLLDGGYDVEVTPVEQGSVAREGMWVVVKSRQGELLMRGVVVLNHDRFWAIRVVADYDKG